MLFPKMFFGTVKVTEKWERVTQGKEQNVFESGIWLLRVVWSSLSGLGKISISISLH